MARVLAELAVVMDCPPRPRGGYVEDSAYFLVLEPRHPPARYLEPPVARLHALLHHELKSFMRFGCVESGEGEWRLLLATVAESKPVFCAMSYTAPEPGSAWKEAAADVAPPRARAAAPAFESDSDGFESDADYASDGVVGSNGRVRL